MQLPPTPSEQLRSSDPLQSSCEHVAPFQPWSHTHCRVASLHTPFGAHASSLSQPGSGVGAGVGGASGGGVGAAVGAPGAEQLTHAPFKQRRSAASQPYSALAAPLHGVLTIGAQSPSALHA